MGCTLRDLRPSTTYAETPAATAARIDSESLSSTNMTIGRGSSRWMRCMSSSTSRSGDCMSTITTSGASSASRARRSAEPESRATTSWPSATSAASRSLERSTFSSTSAMRSFSNRARLRWQAHAKPVPRVARSADGGSFEEAHRPVALQRAAVEQRVGMHDDRMTDQVEQRHVGDRVGVEPAARQVDRLALDQLLDPVDLALAEADGPD